MDFTNGALPGATVSLYRMLCVPSKTSRIVWHKGQRYSPFGDVQDTSSIRWKPAPPPSQQTFDLIKEIYSVPDPGAGVYDGFSTIADGSKVADPRPIGFPHRPFDGIMGGARHHQSTNPLGDVRPCDRRREVSCITYS